MGGGWGWEWEMCLHHIPQGLSKPELRGFCLSFAHFGDLQLLTTHVLRLQKQRPAQVLKDFLSRKGWCRGIPGGPGSSSEPITLPWDGDGSVRLFPDRPVCPPHPHFLLQPEPPPHRQSGPGPVALLLEFLHGSQVPSMMRPQHIL